MVAYQCAPRILQRCVQQDNGASYVTKHLIGPAAAGTAQLRAWESIFRWGHDYFDDLERDLGIDGRHLIRDQIAEAWASFGAQFMAAWTRALRGMALGLSGIWGPAITVDKIWR
jgi:hypothetical protein